MWWRRRRSPYVSHPPAENGAPRRATGVKIVAAMVLFFAVSALIGRFVTVGG